MIRAPFLKSIALALLMFALGIVFSFENGPDWQGTLAVTVIMAILGLAILASSLTNLLKFVLAVSLGSFALTSGLTALAYLCRNPIVFSAGGHPLDLVSGLVVCSLSLLPMYCLFLIIILLLLHKEK